MREEPPSTDFAGVKNGGDSRVWAGFSLFQGIGDHDFAHVSPPIRIMSQTLRRQVSRSAIRAVATQWIRH